MTRSFVNHRLVSPVERAICGRMSYTGSRGSGCNINVLNAHATTEEKSDDAKEFF